MCSSEELLSLSLFPLVLVSVCRCDFLSFFCGFVTAGFRRERSGSDFRPAPNSIFFVSSSSGPMSEESRIHRLPKFFGRDHLSSPSSSRGRHRSPSICDAFLASAMTSASVASPTAQQQPPMASTAKKIKPVFFGNRPPLYTPMPGGMPPPAPPPNNSSHSKFRGRNVHSPF